MTLAFLRGLAWLSLNLLVMLALLCALIVVQGRRDETRPASAAIVLGAAQWNGAPSPVLRARLDHALDLYRRGTVRRLILTGGIAPGDSTSEAAAGRDYLLSEGVPEAALLLEDRGVSTWASMSNAVLLAREQGMTSALLVSDSYHMLRALKMGRDLGFDVAPSPLRAPDGGTGLLVMVPHVLREAGAYLAYIFAGQ